MSDPQNGDKTEKPEPLLKVRDLSVKFPIRSRWLRRLSGYLHAVRKVSFDIYEGECLGLVGESGSGKTTVGRSILRVVPASGGSISLRVDGGEIDVLAAEGKQMSRLRRTMQMVFQDPYSSLNPRMSVMDNVGEPLLVNGMRSRRERIKRVEELLCQVGLNVRLADRFPHAFSGGQRQRVGIARALALRPKLLIADEAVSALDVSVQAQILNLLRRLRREEQLTYLFITHDMSVVSHLCDRVAVMYQGGIVEVGKVADVFARPLHPYTAALLAAIPVSDPSLRGKRKLLKGETGKPVDADRSCPFHTRCPHAEDLCRNEVPVLREVEKGHFAACHFSEKLDLSGILHINKIKNETSL